MRDVLWELVEERFTNDDYLLQLSIFRHIYEVYVKYKNNIICDVEPFGEEYFLKELADLYILLSLLNESDEDFSDLVEERKNKFIGKTLKHVLDVGKRYMMKEITKKKESDTL